MGAPSKIYGFIPIPRAAAERFKDRPEHLLAYFDLELSRDFTTGGIDLSIKFWARRWGWSRHKARDFLLEARPLLANPLGDKGHPKGHPKGHQYKDLTSRITTTTTTPPPENPGGIYTWGFLKFWAAYPTGRRIEKKKAFKAWQRQGCEQVSIFEIMDAIQIWNRYWQGSELKFIPWPSTFLNGRRWENTPEGKNIIMGDRQHASAPSPEADALLERYEELEG